MGENATGVLDFQKMISAGATDFVQPSVVKIGGLTNLWQVATAAEKAGVTCVPHAFFFGPGYLATLHAIAAKERDGTARALVRRCWLYRLCEDRAGGRRRDRCAGAVRGSGPIRRRS